MMDQLSWYLFYPEIALLAMACAVTLVDLTVTSARRTTTYLCSLLTLAVVAVMQFFYAYSGSVMHAFGGLAVSDPMGNWLKLFSTVAVMVCLVYGRVYAADREMLRGGEWFSLSLFALLGILTMISANNLLIVYLGLELLTLSSYALVALRRENGQAIEAAMKYFVLGAMASGFLLYGMSMIYGATGALNIDQIALALNTGVAEQRQLALVLGLVFVVAGLAFKFGVVPFHMWIPDVYQGAPTAVTLFVGTAPKLAAFAIAMRLLVEGLKPLAWDWQQMLGLLAIASLLVGNLAAIAQTNIKRMLAYSTISHMGFVFLGLLAGVVAGGGLAQMEYAYGAAMFYTVTYVLTSLAGFGIVLILSRQGFESENISDFAGLNRRRPFHAAIMALVMLSMAGIPPLVGFYAKLAVLQALVATGQAVYIGLAVFAVIMSLIGAFYYIRVIKVMYFDESPAGPQFVETGCATAPEARVVLAVNGLLLLLLGILPGALMALCSGSIRVLLLRLL